MTSVTSTTFKEEQFNFLMEKKLNQPASLPMPPANKIQPWKAARQSKSSANSEGKIHYSFGKGELLLLEGHSSG